MVGCSSPILHQPKLQGDIHVIPLSNWQADGIWKPSNSPRKFSLIIPQEYSFGGNSQYGLPVRASYVSFTARFSQRSGATQNSGPSGYKVTWAIRSRIAGSEEVICFGVNVFSLLPWFTEFQLPTMTKQSSIPNNSEASGADVPITTTTGGTGEVFNPSEKTEGKGF